MDLYKGFVGWVLGKFNFFPISTIFSHLLGGWVKLLHNKHVIRHNTRFAPESKEYNNDHVAMNNDDLNRHGRNLNPSELDSDLKSLPIIIDEQSKEYTKMMYISKVILAFEEVFSKISYPELAQLREGKKKIWRCTQVKMIV